MSADDPRQLQQEALSAIAGAKDERALDEVRVRYLGKKGLLSSQMKGLGKLPAEERKARGQALNQVKQALEKAIEERRAELKRAALEQRLKAERVDVTLPARPEARGVVHPVSHVWEEVVEIFADLGFSVAEGPHIETDWYNFEALNIPPEHPARQEHDTFYFHAKEDGSRKLLRTHTSPVQIRTMEANTPPIRIIAPGRTFRCDSDQTHTPMFHQVEALVIDRDITMGHLKWTLEEFCKAFFETDTVKMRFRASHFPFTEPSMEVDINCTWEGGQVKVGEGDDWLEILGSGMVHPNVLKAGGLNPDEWQGYAFGIGLDRLAMLKYGIPDLRAFFESDVRWLRHYGFSALQIPELAGGLSA